MALAACGDLLAHPPPAPRPGAAAYPVTVTNCGTPVTYDSAPTRAVSNDINTTEDMLALGLESRMVGTFGVIGDGPVGQPVPAAVPGRVPQGPRRLPDYFTLEQLVGLHPDFLFAGWNYGLQTGTNLTPHGPGQVRHQDPGPDRVLRPRPAGQQLGQHQRDLPGPAQPRRDLQRPRPRPAADRRMQAQVAAAHAKVAGLKPVTVFDYDSGQSAPFTGPGPGHAHRPDQPRRRHQHLRRRSSRAGPRCPGSRSSSADPQCIIINDYGTPTAAQKEKFLETSPITKNLTAVKNRCFLPLSYDEVTPGPRNAEAVTAIARWLHPAAYGLPADGS